MADMKPAFLETFENAHATLQTLAAQDAKGLPKNAAPEAVAFFAQEIWEKHVRMVSLLREANHEIGKGLEIIRDLHLSKEPDVERIAAQIWANAAAQRSGLKVEDAFKAAESFVALRNQRRQSETRAPAPVTSPNGGSKLAAGIPTQPR